MTANLNCVNFTSKTAETKKLKNLRVKAVTSSNNCVTGCYYAQLLLDSSGSAKGTVNRVGDVFLSARTAH